MNRKTNNKFEKIKGCLMGGAIGDAIGFPFEGQSCKPKNIQMDIGGLSKKILLKDYLIKFGCSGFVVESVPAAIFAAEYSTCHGFDKAIHEILWAGGDTDSIASMFGQIYGAGMC